MKMLTDPEITAVLLGTVTTPIWLWVSKEGKEQTCFPCSPLLRHILRQLQRQLVYILWCAPTLALMASSFPFRSLWGMREIISFWLLFFPTCLTAVDIATSTYFASVSPMQGGERKEELQTGFLLSCLEETLTFPQSFQIYRSQQKLTEDFLQGSGLCFSAMTPKQTKCLPSNVDQNNSRNWFRDCAFKISPHIWEKVQWDWERNVHPHGNTSDVGPT